MCRYILTYWFSNQISLQLSMWLIGEYFPLDWINPWKFYRKKRNQPHIQSYFSIFPRNVSASYESSFPNTQYHHPFLLATWVFRAVAVSFFFVVAFIRCVIYTTSLLDWLLLFLFLWVHRSHVISKYSKIKKKVAFSLYIFDISNIRPYFGACFFFSLHILIIVFIAVYSYFDRLNSSEHIKLLIISTRSMPNTNKIYVTYVDLSSTRKVFSQTLTIVDTIKWRERYEKKPCIWMHT